MPGGFKPKCCMPTHEEVSQTASSSNCDALVYLNNGRLVPTALMTHVYSSGIRKRNSQRTPSVCLACVDIFKASHGLTSICTDVDMEDSSGVPQTNDWVAEAEFVISKDDEPAAKRIHLFHDAVEIHNQTQDHPTTLQTVLFFIDQADSFDLEVIASRLGSRIKADIQNRAKKSTLQSRANLVENISYDAIWQNDQNPVLKSFFHHLVDKSGTSLEEEKRQRMRLVKTVDGIYSAINPKYVSNSALAESLVMYFYSNSKLCCQLLAHANSSGSFATIHRYLETIGSVPTNFPSGDIEVALDNNQVLGRSTRIKMDSKMPSSTVTSICVFRDTENANLQKRDIFRNPLLSPDKKNPEKYNHLLIKYDNFNQNTVNKIHREYRLGFLKDRLTLLLDNLIDVGDAIGNDEGTVSDQGCGLLYDRVPAFSSSVEACPQEAVLTNPNTKCNVKRVLDHILEKTEESDPEKMWIPLYCDGLPYGMIHNLVSNTIVCVCCKTEVSDKEMESHKRNCTGAVFQLKYKKLILKPGNGHYELNLCRAFLSVYFEIFIKPIVGVFNFESYKSLEWLKAGKDHHFTWQLLQVLMESMTDELLFQYVEEAKQHGMEPTVPGFCNWEFYHTNPNIKMCFDMLFEFLHPIFLFRAGIRRCNPEVALAGREKASALFYGFSHRIYAKINACDTLFLLENEGLAYHIMERQSLRLAGHENGESGDFLLENFNSVFKFYLPARGVPTKKQWLTSSRSISLLQQIKDTVFTNVGIEPDETKGRHIDLKKEIFGARKIIRASGMLKRDVKTLMTLDKKEISMAFLNIVPHCESNRIKYYKEFLTGQTPRIHPFPIPLAVSKVTKRKKDPISKILQECKDLILNLNPIQRECYQIEIESCKTEEEAVLLLDAIEEFLQYVKDMAIEQTFASINLDHIY